MAGGGRVAGSPHFPGRAPIDAYGNGGFRFANMSHIGSLLIVPAGIHAWNVTDAADATEQDFELVLAAAREIDFVLFGTGPEQVMPPPEVERALAGAGVGIEPMNTGAACRTYNLLLGEARAFAAALIAVE